MLSVSFEEEASGQLPERPLLLLRCFLELLLEGLEDVCQAVDSSPHSSESYSESEGPPSESDIWKNRQDIIRSFALLVAFGGRKERAKGNSGPPNFEATKISAFSTNAKSRFGSFQAPPCSPPFQF